MLEIKKGIVIREEEIVFKFSRSSGPGGQNVNKANTRVTLLFDVAGATGLSEAQKKQILERLAGRADKNGVIRVVSQQYRTQKGNREAAVKRFQELLQEALKKKPVRRKTRVPKQAKQERREEKKRRSELKHRRTKKFSMDRD
jgi:ribosome-associated protein